MTYFMLSFDDGYLSDFTHALPVLAEAKVVASTGIITNVLGTSSYMSEGHVQALSNCGWEIASHTHTHRSSEANGALPGYGTDGIDTIGAEFETSQHILRQLTGQPVNSLFWPGSGTVYNDAHISVARRHFKQARGPIEAGGFPTEYWSGVYHKQPLVKIWNVIGATLKEGELAEINAYIDAAVTNGWSLAIKVHEIVDSGATGYQTNLADFQSMVDKLASYPDCPKLTFSKWVEELR